VTALFLLSAAITAISLTMVFAVLTSFPVQFYLVEIIIGSSAGLLFLPIFKLFTYHLGLFYSRQTTNEDLKELYLVLNGQVPFKRCDFSNRSSLAPLKAKLMLSISRDSRGTEGQPLNN
jgi:hypothetical protein